MSPKLPEWSEEELPMLLDSPRRRPAAKYSLPRIALLAVASSIILVPTLLLTAPTHRRQVLQAISAATRVETEDAMVWPDTQQYDRLPLKSQKPSARLLDNLLPDTEYLSSLVYGGVSNQFISTLHLLQIARMTDRVAILPSLVAPSQHIDHAPPRRFGDQFDLAFFRRQTDSHVAEWADLKRLTPIDSFTGQQRTKDEHFDRFGAYSAFQEVYADLGSDKVGAYVHSSDSTFWPMTTTNDTRLRPLPGSDGINYAALIAWLEDKRIREVAVHEEYETRVEALEKGEMELQLVEGMPHEVKNSIALVKPDPRFIVFDHLFFVDWPVTRGGIFNTTTGARSFPEGRETTMEDMSWIQTGQHLRFTQHIEDATSDMLRSIFGLGKNAPIQPFIAIHIRRGDFVDLPGLGTATLDSYAATLEIVQRRLDNEPLYRQSPPIALHPSVPKRDGWTAFDRSVMSARRLPVLVLTDEKDDLDFLAQIDARGWTLVDHMKPKIRTHERYQDRWMPGFIDSAIMARASGLVMTAHSTYSALAGLRVRAWSGGVAEFTDIKSR